MKTVIQRVKEARVLIDGKIVNQIKRGILVFLCVEKADTRPDADYLVDKLLNLRIFEDIDGKMNFPVLDIKGEFMVISQFTLAADCAKGRRPSFDAAAEPKLAEELYEYFIWKLKKSTLEVKSGVFGAMMDISLVNDGPVTFIIESKPA